MSNNKSAKILSVLMGLLAGLVVIFLILASLFPDLNFPNLSALLSGSDQQAEIEQLDENLEANQAVEQLSEEQKLISLTASEDDTQAWDLLIDNHQVIYQEFDFGIFIEGIDGLKGDQENFWAIYVNDQSSLVGIMDIVLNEGDVLEFRYEAIEE